MKYAERLWFDVEPTKETTLRFFYFSLILLWFDVEPTKETTGLLEAVLSPGCGLM